MLFSLLKKKKNHMKNTGQPNPQPEPIFNLLKMTRFLLVIHLARNLIDLTQT